MQQRSEFVVYVHSPASSQSVLLRQTGNRCCGQRAAAGGGPPVHRLPLVSARRRLPASQTGHEGRQNLGRNGENMFCFISGAAS
uniref:Uncharacterized protein n=1 Tax=Macrostomum lignano TaxID=282301 RepID=A0A1I8JNR3_9PLAT